MRTLDVSTHCLTYLFWLLETQHMHSAPVPLSNTSSVSTGRSFNYLGDEWNAMEFRLPVNKCARKRILDALGLIPKEPLLDKIVGSEELGRLLCAF